MIKNHKIFARTLLALLALVLLLGPVPPARAEANARELEYAYISASHGYFLLGEEVTFDVVVPDTSGLEFEFNLYYTHDRVETGNFQGIDRQKQSARNSYAFTPKDRGQYFLEVWIYDKQFRSQKLQSEPFYAYDKADEQDSSTLPGRVQHIKGLMDAQNLDSNYDKALFLHDWLTHNADYDEPMTIHTPEGVLLQGTGVCESYALAYQMLLHQAGIKSLYVTGYSRGESHAWNLVDFDGEWAWVDVTWDDPVGGGSEGHDYFGMNDDLLGRDHDWSFSNVKPPKATSLAHNHSLLAGARPFVDLDSMAKLLADEMDAKNPSIRYSYQGTDRYFDVGYEIQRFMKNSSRLHDVDSWSLGFSSRYSGTLDLVYGDYDDYGRFLDNEGLGLLLQEGIRAKNSPIKVYYLGEDNYYDIGSPLRRWLDEHAFDEGATGYSYTYYPHHAVVEVHYP